MNVSYDGFATEKPLSKAEAMTKKFHPLHDGAPWGKPWQYLWLKTDIILPPSAKGKRIVFFPNIGGEMLIRSNDIAIGSVDKQHYCVTLTRNAKEGERFSLLLESYAGHGQQKETCGPLPCGVLPRLDEENTHHTIHDGSLCIWNETVYQTLMDYKILSSLMNAVDQKSLRFQEVRDALLRFTFVADLEDPDREKREGSIKEGRKLLRNALSKKNGDSVPCFSIIGQSHLDIEWKWTLVETRRKVARTYSNQLSLMEDYPSFRFLLCEPYLLDMLEENNPELMESVKKRMKSGNFVPDGAFYVEPDTNIPGAETLLRNLCYGQEWFISHTGKPAESAWLPDSFGFSAALPQLFCLTGVSHFATDKLLKSDPECAPFPYNLFHWTGMDGSTVDAHVFMKENSLLNPEELQKRWHVERNQKEGISTLLFPFGYGDGGGGPDRDMLESASRLSDLEGVPRTTWRGLSEFFDALDPLPATYKGELYYTRHRGAYTAQHHVKQLFRGAEMALKDAEAIGTFASFSCDLFRPLWKRLILRSFHDVVSGVSIRKVTEETVEDLSAIAAECARLEKLAMKKVTKGKKGSVTLFSTCCSSRGRWVPLPGMDGGAISRLPHFVHHGELFVYCHPTFGLSILKDEPERGKADRVRVKESEEGWSVSNGRVLFLLHRDGTISGLPGVKGKGNLFSLHQDINWEYDAWELSRYLPEMVTDRAHDTSVTLETSLADIVSFRLSAAIGGSHISEEIILRSYDPYVEFDLDIDWHETRKILKVSFPTDYEARTLVSEAQGGYVERSVDEDTQEGRDHYEVCQGRYSVLSEGKRSLALLNESSPGVSCRNGVLALSLLRSPVLPDPSRDEGEHHLRYALYPMDHAFPEGDVPLLSEQFSHFPLCLKDRAPIVQDRPVLDDDDVELLALKRKETGEGTVIRLMERSGSPHDLLLNLPSGEWEKEDALEKGCGTMVESHVRLHPFEIVSLGEK